MFEDWGWGKKYVIFFTGSTALLLDKETLCECAQTQPRREVVQGIMSCDLSRHLASEVQFHNVLGDRDWLTLTFRRYQRWQVSGSLQTTRCRIRSFRLWNLWRLRHQSEGVFVLSGSICSRKFPCDSSCRNHELSLLLSCCCITDRECLDYSTSHEQSNPWDEQSCSRSHDKHLITSSALFLRPLQRNNARLLFLNLPRNIPSQLYCEADQLSLHPDRSLSEVLPLRARTDLDSTSDWATSGDCIAQLGQLAKQVVAPGYMHIKSTLINTNEYLHSNFHEQICCHFMRSSQVVISLDQ